MARLTCVALVAAFTALAACVDDDNDDGADAGLPGNCSAFARPEGANVLLAFGEIPTKVYRYIDGEFEQVWSSTAPWNDATDLDWADYDGDGDLDLAVAKESSPSRVYRNDGDTFVLASELPRDDNVSSENSIAWGDYDGDGDPDLAVGNDWRNGVYANSGGTFDLAWEPSIKLDTQAVRWGDYDDDGDLDLAFGNFAFDPSMVADNRGDLFGMAWAAPMLESTTDLEWGDYDGDGDLDLLIGNYNQPDRVYRNDNGTFDLVWSSAESDDTTDVAWSDYDCDGDLDIAAAIRNVDGPGQQNRLYESTDGGYELVWSSDEIDRSLAIAWGDYDGDGDPDLVVGNKIEPSRVYRNDDGAMTLAHSFEEETSTTTLAWGIW